MVYTQISLIMSAFVFGALGLRGFLLWKNSRRSRIVAGNVGEDKVSSLLEQLHFPFVHKILVEGRPGRIASIDHIIKGQYSLIVVETKNWNGVIHGKRREREWTQVRNNGEHVAQRNPIMQVKRQAKIVSEAFGVPVDFIVIMAGKSKYHEGEFPQEIVTLNNLHIGINKFNEKKDNFGVIKDDIDKAWKEVVKMSGDPNALKKINRYAENKEAKYGDPVWILWMVLAISVFISAFLNVDFF